MLSNLSRDASVPEPATPCRCSALATLHTASFAPLNAVVPSLHSLHLAAQRDTPCKSCAWPDMARASRGTGIAAPSDSYRRGRALGKVNACRLERDPPHRRFLRAACNFARDACRAPHDRVRLPCGRLRSNLRALFDLFDLYHRGYPPGARRAPEPAHTRAFSAPTPLNFARDAGCAPHVGVRLLCGQLRSNLRDFFDLLDLYRRGYRPGAQTAPEPALSRA